ncbi:hypothetical protein [Mycolicibacterium grossiae]|uniref:hypothetical protein n=1 Tax=Mycolicibacterium grossiae TaxID=1552759 RepID=UPI000A733DFC|nr:hypothetical protein [Mycolicibacterium grossiae]
MAAKHRTVSARTKRVAVVATATATVSALTVGAAPAPAPTKPVSHDAVDLAAAIRLLPNSSQVPDLTGGLGSALYGSGQAVADQLTRAVVNGINLAALAQAAGIDPRSLLDRILTDVPSNLLPGILASLTQELPIVPGLLQALGLSGLDLTALTNLINLLGVDELTDATLTGVLALLGLDLADPLNLGGLDIPGLNVITAGPTFSALKTLGVDLGWVPGLPNSVANAINDSEYANLGVDGLLREIVERATSNPLVGPVLALGLNQLLNQVLNLTDNIPDVLAVRAVPTIGIGMGAFATAMAYEQVIADLVNQPGGNPAVSTDAILGSLTILPMVLINNPARPDGGLLARFGPLAALFGINTVNPTTQVTGVGGTGGGPFGLHLGGANVLPILVDAGIEYQPLSDLASWPNAFTLTNNLAAALSPTYMLRGLTLEGLDDDILELVQNALNEATSPTDPLALNLYLTLQSKTLPMLEPLYLASDFLNVVGLSPLAQIPMRIANALAPALSILTNIGYANVVQNPDGTYTRDFTDANVETPFLSFANIDYGRALGDAFNAFVGGIQKEFFSGNPTAAGPNVLQNLITALFDGSLLGGTGGTGGIVGGLGNPLGGLGGLVNGLTGVINNLVGGLLGGLGLGGLGAGASTLNAARTVSDVPDANARFSALRLPAGAETDATSSAQQDGTDAEGGQTETGKDAAGTAQATEGAASGEQTEQQGEAAAGKDQTGTETPGTQTPATETPTEAGGTGTEGATDEAQQGQQDETATETSTPKHAKPDDGTEPAASTSTPKHAKPDTEESSKPALNVVRDSADASKDKPASTSGTTGGDAKDGTTAGSTTTSTSSTGSTTSTSTTSGTAAKDAGAKDGTSSASSGSQSDAA